MKLQQASGAPSKTVEELERFGPKYQLEVAQIMSDYSCVIGGTDASLVQSWHDALQSAVQRCGGESSRRGATAAEKTRRRQTPRRVALGAVPPAGLPDAAGGAAAAKSAVAAPRALRHHRDGHLGKARQAMTGSMKTTLEHAGVLSHRDGRARDGWSTRVVV